MWRMSFADENIRKVTQATNNKTLMHSANDYARVCVCVKAMRITHKLFSWYNKLIFDVLECYQGAYYNFSLNFVEAFRNDLLTCINGLRRSNNTENDGII